MRCASISASISYLLIVIACTDEAGGSVKNVEVSLPDRILDAIFVGYQNRDRPTELKPKEATIVSVYLQWLSITSVDVQKMEYTLYMYLRQLWVDPRLAWDKIPLYKNYTKKIVSPRIRQEAWIPDLFFRNGKEGRVHKMTRNNYFTRVSPSGEVLYSQKITMIFACQMALQTFPMDSQRCHINIGSYGYTNDQLKFIWLNRSSTPPVKLPKNMPIPEFGSPESPIIEDCTKSADTETGYYSCLKATFILSRQLGWWLASTYVPNILVVMMSWLNFWISLEAVPARVALGLLTLLGTLTQATSLSSSLPKVSYIKAIDVWTMACIIFNIGVLIEFAVASNLARKVSLPW